MRKQPISKHYVALAEEVYRLLDNRKSWGTIFTATEALRAKSALEARAKGEKATKHGSPEAQRNWAHDYRLCTKAIPPKLRVLVRRIAPPGSKIVRVIWPEEDEDYNIAVVVPDGIPYDEVRQLEARLLRALAAYDYQESDKDHYPLTICRVWREREWGASPEQMQAEVKQPAATEATLGEGLRQGW